MQNHDTVKTVGEQKLLAIVQRFCPLEMIGDDGAIVGIEAGKSLVVTSDMLVDGVHFSDRTTPPFSVGWRGATANLSDLAAMGATPLGLTVSLSLSPDLPVAWIEELYRGLKDCCDRAQTAIIGGDLCRSNTVTVAITALGQATPPQVIRRNAARVGDKIIVTGLHGGSRAGLELLLHPDLKNNLASDVQNRLINAHQTPRPRLDILPHLWALQPPLPVAGMDSSDGLADAVVQICKASGVGAILDRNAIALPPGIIDLVSLETAWDWVFYGGEDFELVLCLPESLATVLVEKIGEDAAIIGTITPESDIIVSEGRGFPPQQLTLDKGFQHFNA